MISRSVHCGENANDLSGRNGGHLSPLAFTSFKSASQRFGTDEALRWLALERHTVSSIVQIIEEHGLEKTVDLVDGGRIELLITPREYAEAKTDYEAAKAAGAPLEDVAWLSADEVSPVYAPMRVLHGTSKHCRRTDPRSPATSILVTTSGRSSLSPSSTSLLLLLLP